MRSMIFGLFAAMIIPCVSQNAQACDGYCNWGNGYGYLYQTLEDRVPYFAAHPPVYYSYPVARPYGYSPFAYPPQVQTPEIVQEMIKPATIINPYVEPASKPVASETTDKTASNEGPQSIEILNPFVKPRAEFVQVSD